MAPVGESASPWPVPIGIRKFVIMSFFTIGVYDVYWFYWNWKRQRDRTDATIHAGLLTFLSPFAAYLLFRDVAADPRAEAKWPPFLLAILYFVMLLSFVGPGWSWLFTFFAFLPLIPVQAAMNRIHANAADGEPRDNRFTAMNVVAIIAGLVFMALLVAAGIMLDSGAFDDLMKQMGPLLQS
jgi:hypothetical protein